MNSGNPLDRPAPLLVVSDVDGTLLNRHDRVTPRIRAAVANMRHAGTVFTMATGRPARWILPVLDQLSVRPLCVCANGAVVYDSAADKVVRAAALEPLVLDRVVEQVTRVGMRIGGVGFAVERVGRSAFDRADELFAVEQNYDHAWLSEEHNVQPLDELIGEPAVKLLVRGGGLSSSELFDLINPCIDPGIAHVTYSWDGGLVEIAAPGVSKRSALEWVAEQIGVDGEETVAFGDMPNDLEMLTWAGLGVAMGNAAEKVKRAADFITADNDSDGVAKVLEQWF
ncbi:HAD family hydrolase [Corynebacterium heidelbergense]|uniref:HAD family hydrolase n=1 Tax=Corynebacterium heidelbergense TaxID=2055947 RepID=A0A364V703_9CORY|nr:HAD family hydrolase [Corynebacterium heidelbergense]RAV32422.1 HAD family hydrolase [Corynebacterium heidelbergense]